MLSNAVLALAVKVLTAAIFFGYLLLTLLGKGFGGKEPAQPHITPKRKVYSKDFL
jgi:hypothetical protein